MFVLQDSLQEMRTPTEGRTPQTPFETLRNPNVSTRSLNQCDCWSNNCENNVFFHEMKDQENASSTIAKAATFLPKQGSRTTQTAHSALLDVHQAQLNQEVATILHES
jgi:hypothetical protein